MKTSNVIYHYDLRGPAHKGVPTPHVQRFLPNVVYNIIDLAYFFAWKNCLNKRQKFVFFLVKYESFRMYLMCFLWNVDFFILCVLPYTPTRLNAPITATLLRPHYFYRLLCTYMIYLCLIVIFFFVREKAFTHTAGEATL